MKGADEVKGVVGPLEDDRLGKPRVARGCPKLRRDVSGLREKPGGRTAKEEKETSYEPSVSQRRTRPVSSLSP